MTEPGDHIKSAWGYLQLGMYEDANDSLDNLSPEFKATMEVMSLRAWVHSESESWESLREVSSFLVHEWPTECQHWIWLGYSTRRCRTVAEAESVLLDALKIHVFEPMIHFNLACYACVMGNLDLSRVRLNSAIELNPEIRTLALADPDLEGLRAWLDEFEADVN